MTERTIRIVQRCTVEEAAAMVAAIRAFEEQRSATSKSSPRPAATDTAAVKTASETAVASRRREGTGVLWTRSESSLGRWF